MNLRCRLSWFHSWSPWSEPKKATVLKSPGPMDWNHYPPYKYEAMVQERRCQDCRLVQVKKVSKGLIIEIKVQVPKI